jgi:Zinc finger C-x8-C-x5-C-x3-H type (and similar)
MCYFIIQQQIKKMFCDKNILQNHIQPTHHNITWQYFNNQEWINFSCSKLCDALTNELNKGTQSCIINNIKYDFINGTMETNLLIPIKFRYVSLGPMITRNSLNVNINVRQTNTTEICRFYNTSKGCGRGITCRYKHVD